MRIIMLFVIFSLAAIPIAIHLGDISSQVWANSSVENTGDWTGVLFIMALFFGLVGFVNWSLEVSGLQRNHVNQDVDTKSQIGVGLTMTTTTFCWSYLYGFTVAPFSNESGWLSGWLLFMVIGLFPIIIVVNNLIGRMVRRRRIMRTMNDSVEEWENVRNIR